MCRTNCSSQPQVLVSCNFCSSEWVSEWVRDRIHDARVSVARPAEHRTFAVVLCCHWHIGHIAGFDPRCRRVQIPLRPIHFSSFFLSKIKICFLVTLFHWASAFLLIRPRMHRISHFCDSKGTFYKQSLAALDRQRGVSIGLATLLIKQRESFASLVSHPASVIVD